MAKHFKIMYLPSKWLDLLSDMWPRQRSEGAIQHILNEVHCCRQNSGLPPELWRFKRGLSQDFAAHTDIVP